MSQDLSKFIREVWSPRVQRLATKKLVAKDICNFEFQAADGDTFHRPYHSDPSSGTYTRNATTSAAGAITTTDITTTDEYLEVNQAPYASFFVDALDQKQSYYKDMNGRLLKRSSYVVANTIDTAILAEYANAGDTVDGSDIAGGTAGQGITLTTSNVLDVLEAFKAELANNDVDNDGDWFLIVDPTNYFKVIEKAMTSVGYQNTDKTLRNGFKGNLLDIDIYMSRNLATSVVSNHNVRHWLGGKKGAIDCVMQENARVEEIKNPSNADGSRRLGTEYVSYSLYGKKTFAEGARELIDVQIRY